MTLFDERQYVGEFVDGYKHGEGKMIYPDGEVKEGIWQKGVYQESSEK